MKQLLLFRNDKRIKKLYNRTAYLKRTGKLEGESCYVTDSQEHLEEHHYDYMYPEETVFLTKQVHEKLHMAIDRAKESGETFDTKKQLYILEFMRLNFIEGESLKCP